MSLAVVVIAAGRADHLARTLSGLDRQAGRPDEVIVVDMRPQQSIADVVPDSARCLPLAASQDDDLPLAAARNAGAAATDADRIVFLDVDCVPARGLIARYDEVLADEPDALACGPVRYLRRGWVEAIGTADPSDDALTAASDAHPVRPDLDPGKVVVAGDHELFWSLSFGVTRAVWAMIGGFDDGYRGYGAEDTDFAFRARALGVRVAWFGGGVAYHQWHEPTRLDAARIPEIVANARRFHARWGAWPMSGWLHEMGRRGDVRFDPAAGVLEVAPP